jgi:tetratricopeptide (TPR) repeat protein
MDAAPASTAVELAAQHFEAGLAHADQRELERAVAEFEQAYALSPHYSVLYNLGLSHAALGHAQKAIAAWERYLAGGRNAIDDARRSRVAEMIGEQRAQLGSLALSVTPSDARITIDEQAALVVPEGIVLDPGQHRLVVGAPGHARYAEAVRIEPGTTASLDVRLAPLEAAPVEPPAIAPRAPARGEPTPERTANEWTASPVPAVLLGTGGLLLGAALVSYLYSNDLYDDWRAHRVTLPPVPRTDAERRAEAKNDALERQISRLDGLALGLSLSGVALVAGAAWLSLRPDEPSVKTGVLGIDVAGSTLRVRGAF